MWLWRPWRLIAPWFLFSEKVGKRLIQWSSQQRELQAQLSLSLQACFEATYPVLRMKMKGKYDSAFLMEGTNYAGTRQFKGKGVWALSNHYSKTLQDFYSAFMPPHPHWFNMQNLHEKCNCHTMEMVFIHMALQSNMEVNVSVTNLLSSACFVHV